MRDFVECDSCAAKPGSPDLCSGCLHNRRVIGDLLEEQKAFLDVWVAAARLRTFPVPFDDHFNLVGQVDECRAKLKL